MSEMTVKDWGIGDKILGILMIFLCFAFIYFAYADAIKIKPKPILNKGTIAIYKLTNTPVMVLSDIYKSTPKVTCRVNNKVEYYNLFELKY